jgi:hypothetical protein
MPDLLELITVISLILAPIPIAVSVYLAYLVKKDWEKANSTVGAEIVLTLGPWRWALIVLITGVLGLALYWFKTYHPIILRNYFSEKKSE